MREVGIHPSKVKREQTLTWQEEMKLLQQRGLTLRDLKAEIEDTIE